MMCDVCGVCVGGSGGEEEAGRGGEFVPADPPAGMLPQSAEVCSRHRRVRAEQGRQSCDKTILIT